jgi:hypothetical protein
MSVAFCPRALHEAAERGDRSYELLAWALANGCPLEAGGAILHDECCPGLGCCYASRVCCQNTLGGRCSADQVNATLLSHSAMVCDMDVWLCTANPRDPFPSLQGLARWHDRALFPVHSL